MLSYTYAYTSSLNHSNPDKKLRLLRANTKRLILLLFVFFLLVGSKALQAQSSPIINDGTLELADGAVNTVDLTNNGELITNNDFQNNAKLTNNGIWSIKPTNEYSTQSNHGDIINYGGIIGSEVYSFGFNVGYMSTIGNNVDASFINHGAISGLGGFGGSGLFHNMSEGVIEFNRNLDPWANKLRLFGSTQTFTNDGSITFTNSISDDPQFSTETARFELGGDNGGTFFNNGSVVFDGHDDFNDYELFSGHNGDLRRAGVHIFGGLNIFENGIFNNSGSLSLTHKQIVNDGQINNTGNISLVGAMDVGATGGLVNALGATMDLDGGFSSLIEGSIQNSGDFSFRKHAVTATDLGIMMVAETGSLENLAGTFTNHHHIDLAGSLAISGGTFDNSGTLDMHHDAAFSLTGGTFDNNGDMLYANDLHIDGGRLINNGTMLGNHPTQSRTLLHVNSGEFINNGSLNSFIVVQESASAINNADILLDINVGNSIQSYGNFENNGAIVMLDRGIPEDIWLKNIGGNFKNTGLIHLDTMNFTSTGTLDNYGQYYAGFFVETRWSGTSVNHAGGEIFIGDPSLTNGSRRFPDSPTRKATFVNSGNFTNHGTFSVASGSDNTFENTQTMVNHGAMYLGAESSINQGLIENNGDLWINAAMTGSGSFVQNAGHTYLNGDLSQSNVTLNGGILSGNGTITSTQTVFIGEGAEIHPGNSAGHIILVSDAIMNGKLVIEVIDESLFDIFEVQGALTLSELSQFEFLFASTFVPTHNMVLDFLRADSIVNFDLVDMRNILVSGLDPFWNWRMVWNDNTGSLQMRIAQASVNEPFTLSLFIIMLSLLLARQRRAFRE